MPANMNKYLEMLFDMLFLLKIQTTENQNYNNI